MTTYLSKSLIIVFTLVSITAFWYMEPMAGGAEMMSTGELKTRIGNSETMVLDVRADSHWEGSDQKIKGALRADPDYFASWAGLIPKNHTIVLYCA